MGGSYSGTGGSYSGGSDSGIYSLNSCGGIHVFNVIVTGNEKQIEGIWNKCKEGDLIQIIFYEDDLPKLEVKRTIDNLLIGYVPPSLSQFINCIKSGWKYTGEIIHISGDKYRPDIKVKVEGEQ